jgi:hypothetical protein
LAATVGPGAGGHVEPDQPGRGSGGGEKWLAPGDCGVAATAGGVATTAGGSLDSVVVQAAVPG